jgi:hypothetical protein
MCFFGVDSHDPIHVRFRGPYLAPLFKVPQCFVASLRVNLHGTIGGIAHPTRDTKFLGFRLRVGTVEDPLD